MQRQPCVCVCSCLMIGELINHHGRVGRLTMITSVCVVYEARLIGCRETRSVVDSWLCEKNIPIHKGFD